MAMARFTMKPRTRVTNGAGHGGKRAVSYLVREGEYAPHQDVGYLTREGGHGTDREDLVWREVGNMPEWAHDDPYRFFGAAYDFERANGRWAMAIEAALPRELSRDQQRELAQDFVRAHLADHPYLMVQHEPVASDGRGQPHIHILFSERKNDGLTRDELTYFKRANHTHPEQGGTAKDRFWNARTCPTRMRQAWADLTNYHLERAGHAVRIDTRSLDTRGIARDSGYTADPSAKTYHSQSPEARADRARTAAEEQREAHAHWEARKRVLGITNMHDVSREAMRDASRQWARDFQPGKQLPLDDLQRRAEDFSRTQRDLEETMARLHVEIRKAERDEREGRSPSFADAEKTARVVAAAERHLAAYEQGTTLARTPAKGHRVGLNLPDDERPQGRTHVRLHVHDEERGRGR